MRCPDCAKMVSYGDPVTEVEGENINSVDVDKENKTITGLVNADVRLMLPCADCDGELKETNFSFEVGFEHKCEKLPEEEADIHQVDFENSAKLEVEAEGTERYETHNPKTGKPISPRFQKRFFGADFKAEITCPFCDETIEATDHDECQASSMDELT